LILIRILVGDSRSSSDSHTTVAEILTVSVVLAHDLAEDIQLERGYFDGMGKNSPDHCLGVGWSGERSLVGHEITLISRDKTLSIEREKQDYKLEFFTAEYSQVANSIVAGNMSISDLDEYSDHC
ncbi:hypothetical protein PENTCL1PPCAC_26755, partial [Pristionchus entomophagus]